MTMDSRLLDRLAAEASPAALRVDLRARARAVVLGVAGAALLSLGWLGARQDIAAAAATSVFWVKLAFPAALGLFAGWAVWRSTHPGLSLRGPVTALLAVVALFWAVVMLRPWIGATAIDWERDFWGSTWRECVASIALMALPMWLPAMAWLRRFGPVRPRMAGALVGFCCGTVAAALYALHCRESGLPFLGSWYLAGAAIPALMGALAGRRWLHW
jgi:hypothetical protein